MQILHNLHEMSNPVYLKKLRKISIYRLLKIYSECLVLNQSVHKTNKKDSCLLFLMLQRRQIRHFCLFQMHLDNEFQGPVVQSVVSLTSALVVKMLTVLVSTISNSQVFLLIKM